MKSRLLLSLLILVSASVFSSAQTFHIEWNEPDTVRGTVENGILKRTGDIVNDNDVEKRLLFRYNMDNMNLDHLASICFSANCFFLFPGPDDPTLRPEQVLAPTGTIEIYADMDPSGIEGPSSVEYTVYDAGNPDTERLTFTCTYIFGDPVSVAEASDHGFSVGPNPASDVVTIRSSEAEVLQGADLYAADGTLLRTYGVTSGAQQLLNVSSLPSGSYHLILRTQSGALLRSPLTIVR